jgi:hypothetical protein
MPGMAEETLYQRRKRLKAERAAMDIVPLMPADRQAKPKAPRLVPSKKAGTVTRKGQGKNLTISDRWATIMKSVRDGEYTWEEFCDGLDADELARGQLKDSRGAFSGRPPRVIPREFHLACQRELMRRFNEHMQEALLDATKKYIQLASDVGDPAVQERMLRYIIERVVGPVPKEVKLSAAPEHEGFLAGVIRKGGTVGRSNRYTKRTETIEDEGYEDEE